MDVVSQSNRIVPVRNRTIPRAAPFGVWGKPPAKSNFRLALVCAPARSGPNASIPICDWRSDPEKAPESPGAVGGVAICGKSRLSTEPRVTEVFSRMIPERRTRYFDPLSTLVWLCSAILSFIRCWSSSRLETRSSRELPVAGISGEAGKSVAEPCEADGRNDTSLSATLAMDWPFVRFSWARSSAASSSARCSAVRSSLTWEFSDCTCDCSSRTAAARDFRSGAGSLGDLSDTSWLLASEEIDSSRLATANALNQNRARRSFCIWTSLAIRKTFICRFPAGRADLMLLQLSRDQRPSLSTTWG